MKDINTCVSEIQEIFQSEFPRHRLTTNGKYCPLFYFLQRLSLEQVKETMWTALEMNEERKPSRRIDMTIHSFCTMCWGKISQMDKPATMYESIDASKKVLTKQQIRDLQ